MSDRWELVLMKEIGDIVEESYDTRKQAEKEVEYRNSLCRHLGYEPDLLYKIRKTRNNR